MSKVSKDKVDRLIHSIALKNNMSDKDMKDLVNSPYEFTHEKIKELDFEGVVTEEEFDKIKTNFMYTGFFKIVVNYASLRARNNRRKNINKVNKQNEKRRNKQEGN